VHLRAALGVRELAHCALHGGLHLEHKPGGGPPPYVEEPPVQPPLRAGARVDRQRCPGQVLDGHRLGDELKAAERHHRVGLDPAGDPDRGLGGQLVQRSLERGPVPPVGDLGGAGVVAHDDELHRALQAERLRPARDGDGLADTAAQAGDGSVDHRFSPPQDLVSDPLTGAGEKGGLAVPPHLCRPAGDGLILKRSGVSSRGGREATFTAAGGSLGSRGPRLIVSVNALLTR
jgi:hypothetical protein